jgi:hypothetical protein
VKVGKPHVAVQGVLDYLGVEIMRHRKKAWDWWRTGFSFGTCLVGCSKCCCWSQHCIEHNCSPSVLMTCEVCLAKAWSGCCCVNWNGNKCGFHSFPKQLQTCLRLRCDLARVQMSSATMLSRLLYSFNFSR